MTEKEKKVRKYQEKFEEAKLFLNNKYGESFTSEYLSSLLGHYFENEDVSNFLIFYKGLDSLDLKSILDKEINSVIGTIKFESPDFDFLISDKIEKAEIKVKGLIWRIHNNDEDPRPSKPHAHEYNLNVRLHLGTGGLYRKKKFIKNINPKEFQRLRKMIVEKGITLPEIR